MEFTNAINKEKYVDYYPKGKPFPNAVLMLFMFTKKMAVHLHNLMVHEHAKLKQYNGNIIGVSEKIKLLDGRWWGRHTIGMFHFKSFRDARMFLDGVHVFHQPDVLEWGDVWVMPLGKLSAFHKGFPVFQLQCISPDFPEAFHSINRDQVPICVSQYGGLFGVVNTGQCEVLRGVPAPKWTILNLWENMSDLSRYITSQEYKPMSEMYKQVGNGFCIAGEIEINILGPLAKPPRKILSKKEK